MKIRHLLFALLLLGVSIARAQMAGFGKVPVEITVGEGGQQRFENGVAIAEKDVVVHHGGTSLYADYVQYSPDTHDMLLIGNVRVYQEGRLLVGDRAIYNLETKLLRAENFRGEMFPFYYQAETLSSMTGKAFQATHITLATSDSSKPEVRLNARTARIYPKDHIILTDVTAYVGDIPVFWFPYIFQSLKGNLGFKFMPGYNSSWGEYLLLRNGFPITDNIHGTAHLDYRTTRGIAFGLDANGTYGKDKQSWVHFKSYYADDLAPNTNTTAAARLPVNATRYRVTLQDRTFFTPDIYAMCDINKLSDYIFLRDFNPDEYVNNPQPDNVAALTKRSENYTLTAVTRAQLNKFFDTTERLPELALDMKRQPLFGGPVFYEGETSAGRLERKFGSDLTVQTGTTNQAGQAVTVNTVFPVSTLDYAANRIDTFHQLSMPEMLGGWLSIVPRLGVRGTYYSQGASSLGFLLPATTASGETSNTLLQSATGGEIFRGVFDAGAELSFKLSRDWDNVQSRAWGLDGLRHVFQPFFDYSFVRTSVNPTEILQFDRLTPSTELPSLDFPQFTTLDSIANWSILRMGARNRWESRRDEATMEWLTVESYLDYNLEKPTFPGFSTDETFSNVVNKITWSPLPWVALRCDCQFPLLNGTAGFTQVNTTAYLRLSENLTTTIAHRYLYGNKYFSPGSILIGQVYYRLNDNWAVGGLAEYEFLNDPSANVVPGVIYQQYQIYRDLSSWVVALGLVLRDNVNASTNTDITETAVTLTFSLKDLPSLGLPVSFDPTSIFTQK